MRLTFVKMHGLGNDFVIIDAVSRPVSLSSEQIRYLADRHTGIGCDQLLLAEPAGDARADFRYRIFNADGSEAGQCGNGARCFARYVRDKGLTAKDRIRVQTLSGVIAPELTPDGRVTVDMGRPQFDPARVPFDAAGLVPVPQGLGQKWPLALDGQAQAATVLIAVVSMGNPHAVQLVEDVDTAPVAQTGPLIECHTRFPHRVNAGYLQVVDRSHVRLRVYERGAGETLACGTGACAAVAAGIRLGLLDARVDVQTRGGLLTIAWSGQEADSVFLTGPAVTVFEGQIDIPDAP